MILCVETSSSVCSVALFKEGELIAIEEISSAKNHSTLIIPMIDQVLQKAGIAYDALIAVAVSAGPGSYTGLRIGVSTVKGFCDALAIPLISVPTLQAMAAGFVETEGITEGLICPMFDARRMEVYYWLGDTQGKEYEKVQPLILEKDSLASYLATYEIYFVGDGAKKASEVLSTTGTFFYPEFQPSARWMGKFAHKKMQAGQLEDVAYYEPFYLKDSESHLKPIVKK